MDRTQAAQVAGLGVAAVFDVDQMVDVQPAPLDTTGNSTAAVAVFDHGAGLVVHGAGPAGEPDGHTVAFAHDPQITVTEQIAAQPVRDQVTHVPAGGAVVVDMDQHLVTVPGPTVAQRSVDGGQA